MGVSFLGYSCDGVIVWGSGGEVVMGVDVEGVIKSGFG